jgi:hypothetical protein
MNEQGVFYGLAVVRQAGASDQSVTCIKNPGVTVVGLKFEPQIGHSVGAASLNHVPDKSERGLLASELANMIAARCA